MRISDWSSDVCSSDLAGRLRLFKDGGLLEEPIAGVPEVSARGQGGLFDVVLHPDFGENGYVYLAYAGAAEGEAGTEVARGRFAGAALEELAVDRKSVV